MPYAPDSIWKKDNGAALLLLEHLLDTTTKSAAEIAEEITQRGYPVSRNAIIGKTRRISKNRGKKYPKGYVSKRQQRKIVAAKNREARAEARRLKAQAEAEKAPKRRGRPPLTSVRSSITGAPIVKPVIPVKPNKNTIVMGRPEQKTKRELMEELRQAVLNTGGTK